MAEGTSGKEGSRNKVGRNTWKFAYEACTHLHSMRLFLFNPALSVPWMCETIKAYLQPTSPFSASPVVVCTWITAEDYSHTVYVPMPFCIIDHSSEFEVNCGTDYIEVKLKLLPFGGSFLDGLTFLGFSHRGIPLTHDDGTRQTETHKRDEEPFSLASDAKLLSLQTNLAFYCKLCLVKFTSSPLREVLEMPSSDWRDLADHWFGTCCCSDGKRTDSLVSKFERLMTPTKGLCLVGSTICVVHQDDLDSDTVQCAVSTAREVSGEGVVSAAGTTVDVNVVERQPAVARALGLTRAESSDLSQRVPSSSEGVHSMESKLTVQPQLSAKISEVSIDHCMGELVEPLTDGHSCDHGECEKRVVRESEPLVSSPENLMKTIANGFMSGAQGASRSPAWNAVCCRSCSAVVGVSADHSNGVQLFKCRVSTDKRAGGVGDIFRYHTLERVFASELLASTEESASYRYTIRGVNSKMPLLQLVLVNQESWNCSGSCLGEAREGSRYDDEENDISIMSSPEAAELRVGAGKEEFPPAFLEPVVKVLFCDISDLSMEDVSGVEDWSERQQADDIYMLETEVFTLIELLRANQKKFPASCAVTDQFQTSFLCR